MIGLIRDKWLQSSFAPDHAVLQHKEDTWNKDNINPTATSIREIFFGFEHIIEVDHYRIYTEHHGFHGWLIPKEFSQQFGYPARELGDHSIVHLIRGNYTNDGNIFTENEFGSDAVFVGTNSKVDALMIALLYK